MRKEKKNGRCDLFGCGEEEDPVFAAAGRRGGGPGAGPPERAGQWTGGPRESETNLSLFFKVLLSSFSTLLLQFLLLSFTSSPPLLLSPVCSCYWFIRGRDCATMQRRWSLMKKKKNLDSCRSVRMRSAASFTGLCGAPVNNVDHVDILCLIQLTY